MKSCKCVSHIGMKPFAFHDIHGAFKWNAITIRLDGSENYLFSSKVRALVWEEMEEFHSKLPSNTHPVSLKKLKEVMIPPDGVKCKLKNVVDNTPSDEGLEIIEWKLTDEEWDDMENEQEENNLDENGSGNMNVVDDAEEHKWNWSCRRSSRCRCFIICIYRKARQPFLIPKSKQI